MKIKLQTNDENQVLELYNLTKNSFQVYVYSEGFSAPAWFSHYESNFTDNFIDNLAKLQEAGSGKVQLKDAEDNELTFDLDKLGHLQISGKLVFHSVPRQLLEFSFKTDQTCLAPFIHDLRKDKIHSNEY